LHQTHKYYAKKDEMKLADATKEPGPEDPFKKEKAPRPEVK
jgi:hypothetical protein